jgi:hypothetical protein
MWACLRPWVATLDEPADFANAAATLAMIVAIGILLYTGTVYALRRTVGSPAGAEREILLRASALCKRYDA